MTEADGYAPNGDGMKVRITDSAAAGAAACGARIPTITLRHGKDGLFNFAAPAGAAARCWRDYPTRGGKQMMRLHQERPGPGKPPTNSGEEEDQLTVGRQFKPEGTEVHGTNRK